MKIYTFIITDEFDDSDVRATLLQARLAKSYCMLHVCALYCKCKAMTGVNDQGRLLKVTYTRIRAFTCAKTTLTGQCPPTQTDMEVDPRNIAIAFIHVGRSFGQERR